MSWEEYYAYDTVFTNLAGGSGNVFTDNEIRIDPDSDFKFMKTMHQPVSARVRVRYRDDTTGRYLMKGTQDLRLISGHAIYSMSPGNPTPPGFVPFIWSRPYVIPGGTTFTVSAADYSGLTTTPYITFHGTKIRSGVAPWDRQYRAKVPMVYPISTAASGTVTIGANGSFPAAIVTDNDAHFVVYKIVGSRIGPCTIGIKDSATGKQWMNQEVHFDNFVGNGHYPHILSSPRFIPRGNTISINLTDLSGAANTVEVNLIGVKLYE